MTHSAMQLIQARSYATVSVERLCRHAGVNKGSFYYFFPSKRALALHALEAQWRQSERNVLRPAFAEDLPPLARVERAFELAYRQHRAHYEQTGCLCGCPFGNLAGELASQDEQVRAEVQAIFRRFQGYFERALDEARAQGVPLAGEVPALAHRLLAYLEGALLLAKVQNDPEVVRRLGAHALQLVLPTTTQYP